MVAVSFDPKDTPEIAAAKKQTYLRRYSRPDTANGWHFLTGDEANIKALTDAVGFHYKYDPATDQFAHASAIMIADARRPAFAIFLRRGIFAARYAPGPGGGFAQQDRHARSTRFCCSVITTTPPPASTAPWP